MYHNVFEQSGDIFTFNGVNTLHKILSTGCFGTIEDVQLIQSLKGKKYDAAFVEHLDACGLIVAELVGIKTVMLFSVQGVSFPARYYLNLPSAPGFVPVYNEVPPSGYEMSFVERAMNLYNYWRYEMYIPKKLLGVAAKLQSADLLPKDFPSVEELGSQISYLFVNSVEFLNFPDFYTPQVKHIGGIGMPKAGNVDNFILPIIEKAKKGVVWFSFGSIVNTKLMNARIRQSFIAAFSQFEEYEFLWQMKDIDEDVKNAFASYNNIHLIEWLNQPALLAHNKTKAMISHGGLTGLFEAINYGVPLISIPMFMDHKRSAALAKYHGIGVILDKYTLTVDKIASALREVLESEIYQQNILKKQKMLKDANPKPEEVFLHSVKYATEHGEELKKINIPRCKNHLDEESDELELVDVGLGRFTCCVFSMFGTIK
ncbi:unnamed protein product [Bursaphelenchus okinawaensis]|uniref:UDP-glucuronosyltransferase n=1 Tax=Bursaphelenchus okinawaensis TaxID=465554 RepID=A0A811K3Q0_9BILA|nr:unnamed protein product [Bursaphelenchus okinawaensis]CAG9089986.1 unnamed protein product [Bursaphelenchus okinawaensis]